MYPSKEILSQAADQPFFKDIYSEINFPQRILLDRYNFPPILLVSIKRIISFKFLILHSSDIRFDLHLRYL